MFYCVLAVNATATDSTILLKSVIVRLVGTFRWICNPLLTQAVFVQMWQSSRITVILEMWHTITYGEAHLIISVLGYQ